MGTSGNMSTSNTYVKYTITINQNSQSTANNTSNVSVSVRFFRTNTGYETYGSGTVYCKINGTTYSASVSPSQKITNSGIVLYSQTLNIGHNNDGTKTLTASAWISLNTPLTSSEQSYSQKLSTIPRAATFSSADNFNDTANPKIYFNNPGGFKLQLKMEAGGNTSLIVRDNLYPSSPYTFSLSTAERNLLRSLTPNSNTLPVRFTVGTYLSSTAGNWSYGDRTMTITSANPSFTSSQLTYKDSNSSIVNITGNNQLIVRNKSNLQFTFTSATAQKYATISKYQTIFNGTTTDRSSAGTYSLGTVNSAQNLTLQVKAIDSRGNSTTISKTVTILDWVPPVINSSAVRVNNYENQTNLLANVQISRVNGINILEQLQYRVKKTSSSTWGSWINFSNNTQTKINLDNLYAWDLQIKAVDKFGSNTHDTVVPKGMPIAFFDTQKLSVGINCFPSKSSSLEVNGKTIFDMIYPVGSIYMSINSTSPATLFGGSWSRWGNGKMPIGVLEGDSDYGSPNVQGGNRHHRHEWRIGMHFWYGTAVGENNGSGTGAYYDGESRYDGWARSLANITTNINTGLNTGANSSSPNGKYSIGRTATNNYLQSFITCYMWRRTA